MWGIRILTWGLPWVIIPGIASPFLEPKELLFLGAGWGMICWRYFQMPVISSMGWRNPWTVWLVGWVIGISLWRFQWQYLLRSPSQTTDIVYNVYNWNACVMVILAFLLLRELVLNYFRSELILQQVTQWMCWVGTLVAGYAILQALGFDQFYPSSIAGREYYNLFGVKGVHAGFGNPGYLAIYLACLFPLFFIFKSRRYLIYAGIVMIAIFLTSTRYAWVIGGIGITASLVSRWWLRCRRWMQYILMLLCTAATGMLGWLGWQILQTDQRLTIWLKTLDILSKHHDKRSLVMTGYGLDSYPMLMGESNRWAHNEWIQLTVEIGIIGVILLAAMVAWSIKSGWNGAKRSLIVSAWFGVWIAFLAASLVHFPGHIIPTAWVGLCALAVMELEEA